MNQVLENIKSRRSIKSYDGIQVDDHLVEQIVESGLYAPSGKGAQCPKIVVLQDKALIKKVASLNAAVINSDKDPFYGAKTLLIVFVPKDRVTAIEDGSVVIGNMLLAAHSLSVDASWIHRAKETFQTEEGKSMMKEWGIPPDYIGVGNCILGYRDKDPKPQASRHQDRVHWIRK